ncbi:MAG: peptide-methionine (S)-S-oxide reductase MsrA [Solirubrobacterales bacterium]
MTDNERRELTAEELEGTQTATFGAGCFWKPEMVYRELDGVVDTAVGYEGGQIDNPTYEMVCSGQTGHAEVVQVTFDPDRVSYEELVDKFWEVHDPTQMNRQGPDVGTQYRSVVFFQDEEQERVATASKDRAQDGLRKEIVTTIEPATGFWRAEEYHQCYLQKRQEGGLVGMVRSALGT